ncbi:MAG: hypothetical protein ACI88G_001746 [Woeseiaceae bacterium]|jgi:hypothetical protein
MMRTTALILLSCLAIVAHGADETTTPDSDSADDTMHVAMHKNPGCGCCEVWADHLRSFGFTVDSMPNADIIEFKEHQGIPRPLMSCHTAIIDGYFVEGHVPAKDILQLLKIRPEHVTGIAVPGMPLGSPGMEHPRPQDFNTIALLSDGSAYVFAQHTAGEDFTKPEE